jgi:hypothetical protein
LGLRTFYYRGKRVTCDNPVRFGKCEVCKKSTRNREITNTMLHHFWYDDSDMLRYTIEVCFSCHLKLDPNFQFYMNTKRKLGKKSKKKKIRKSKSKIVFHKIPTKTIVPEITFPKVDLSIFLR